MESGGKGEETLGIRIPMGKDDSLPKISLETLLPASGGETAALVRDINHLFETPQAKNISVPIPQSRSETNFFHVDLSQKFAPAFAYCEDDLSSSFAQNLLATSQSVYPKFSIYDGDLARAFIGDKYEDIFVTAFDILWHPGMRADYFRLLKLYTDGGLGFDHDQRPTAPLSIGLDQYPAPYLALSLVNGEPDDAVICSSPRNPLIGLILFKATYDLLFADPAALLPHDTTGFGIISRALQVYDTLYGQNRLPPAEFHLFQHDRFFAPPSDATAAPSSSTLPPKTFLLNRHRLIQGCHLTKGKFAEYGAPIERHFYGNLVEKLYWGLLGREPDEEGFHHYTTSLYQGCDLADVISDIAFSLEHRLLRARRDTEAIGYDPDLPCLVFLHVEKTAGTSLTEMLCHSLDAPSYIEKRDVLLGLSACEMSQFDFFAGHFNYDTLSLIPREKRIFTFLRDPRERLISLYNFWRCHPEGHPAEHDLIRLARDFPPREFFAHPLVQGSASCWNHMIWCLFGNRAWTEWKNLFEKTDKRERATLLSNFRRSASAHLENFFFIGFSHDFVNSYREFIHLLGLPQQEILHLHSIEDLRAKEGFLAERSIKFDPLSDFLDSYVVLDQIVFDLALEKRPGWRTSPSRRSRTEPILTHSRGS